MFVALLVVGGIFSASRPESGSFAASAWEGLEPSPAAAAEPMALDLPSTTTTTTIVTVPTGADPATGCTVPATSIPTGRLVSGSYAGESSVHVEIEEGLALDPDCVAEVVAAAIDTPPTDVTVTVASPAMVGRLCAPLDTTGLATCWNGSRALIDADRWIAASPDERGELVRGQLEVALGADIG